jgi:hypothetical protein
MRTLRPFALFPFALVALAGCGAAAVPTSSVELTSAVPGSLTVGEPRVLSTHADPMEPITARTVGDAIAVTFALRGQCGSTLVVDPNSLGTRSSAEYEYDKQAAPPSLGAERVALKDGGSLVVWSEGSPEWGHRALAQSFGEGHLPRTSPIAISPSEMDVIGAPHAATTDGRRVVVTLAASEGQGIELIAVPIDVP